MLGSFWKTLVFLAALPLQNVSAQQYMGDVIPNTTYPSVPGSEIVYFRVKDPAGVNNNLTLVNYQSFGSNGKRIDPAKVKRAVIIIHGLNRDAGTYMSNMLSALSQVTGDSNINFDSVVINAPSFPNGDDKNASYPYWDYAPSKPTKKLSGGAQSWTNILVWKGSQWAGGGTNQYPTKAQSVSSYEVLDQLVAWYANKSNFPNINQVVIAGHSLGGQTVQRYAAVGKSLGLAVPITYWIANPNSLVWLNSSRPLSTSSCPDYDEWRDGLSNYTGYPSIYNTGLVASGDAAVLSNYESKNKAYARGTLDMGDDSTTCAPFTTGSNRHERFYYFINWWTPTCEAANSTTGHCDTVDLIPMGHDGGGMMASSAGRARLFSDNFYGDGARSYDFGYPRIQANVDDPYPNPAYNSSTTSANPGVYANNMTYVGCYTDSGSRTLANMLYDSQSNTVEMCTTACANAGYAIAGMEYGSQCWCDNTIGPYTEKVLDLGCSTPCPGNSTENCGQSNRLQLYSNSTLVQTEAPSNPEVVGNYYYAGCHNESTSGRALSATSYSDGKNMTLENCAAFCNGYKYFGIEYAGECYCGSYFGAGSAIASDSSCSMVCTGNSLELCGGGGALSVYELSSDANVTTITQGSTTAGSTSPTNTGSSSSLPSSSLCPATNGQSIADSNNITYTIACSSDTSVGSYSSAQASGSYFDCMVACDNAASSGCVAFTYVGGALGSGSGTCYLKNSVGSFTSAANNLVSGSRNSTGSTGALATSTSSGASTSATGVASSSLCPATDGQTVADSNNVTYTVACSSDTSIGSYASAQASSSYFDCMVACDNAASSGCVAFTYVGGALGSGSGTCYLKNSVGSFTGAANNLVSGSRVSSGSTSGTVTTTTSSAAAAATTYADGSTPSVNGVTFDIQINVTYSGQTLTLTKKRAAAVVGDCLNTCSQSTSCVGTAFDGSVCTYYGSIDNSTKVSAPGTTFATVQSRSTATSTSSSSTGVPSASLCPSANGQTVNGYVVSCSSDTNIGSYSSANAVNSYLDCMSACNAAASTGCVAFTYVGGNNGVGSGACYLKNSKGSFTTAGGPNYIAGMVASQASSSSSSSSISSTQSGSASSSAVTSSSSSAAGSSSSTATSSSATASASSSLCPSIDSQDITDSNGQVYTIRCQSDTNVGSFTNAQAANSYADCMTACDSTTGCVAFTYVGGAQGSGSGTCWMKNSRGSATSAGGNNYVAGFLKQSASSSVSSSSSASSSSATSSTVSSTTVSSSATASSSASASLCPQANGQIVTDANGKTYNVTCSSDNSVGSYTNAQASSSYLDCMTACDAASSSGCQGFTYVGGANGAGSGTCWLKTSMGTYTANGNNYISAVLVVNSNSNSNVASLSSSSSSVSSSTASSSSASSSTVSSSTASSSSTSSVTSTSSSSSVSSSSSSSSVSSSSSTSSSSSMITSSSTTASSSSSSSTASSSSSSVSSSSSSSSVASSSSSTVSSSSSTVSSSSSSSVSSSSSSSASSSSSSVATTLSTSTASASASSSTALSLPTGFSSYGCFVDGSTRALPYNAYSGSDNTPYKCASTCQSLGYKYAGTEYGRECWCSNSAPTSSAKSTDCNMACSGDSTQTCGAGNRLSVYVNNNWVSTFNARQSYGTWNLMACYTDNTNGRVLPNTMSMTGGASNATIANCLDACAKSGLKVCGAEYYQECYGGSVAPSSSLIAGSDPLAAGCNYPCNGNKTEACGGSNKILVYINNGTASAARRW